jgi:hypothetical protein
MHGKRLKVRLSFQMKCRTLVDVTVTYRLRTIWIAADDFYSVLCRIFYPGRSGRMKEVDRDYQIHYHCEIAYVQRAWKYGMQ